MGIFRLNFQREIDTIYKVIKGEKTMGFLSASVIVTLSAVILVCGAGAAPPGEVAPSHTRQKSVEMVENKYVAGYKESLEARLAEPRCIESGTSCSSSDECCPSWLGQPRCCVFSPIWFGYYWSIC